MGLHGCCRYRVRTQEGLSRHFELEKGFREGDPSSPVCFNIYHSCVLNDLRSRLQNGFGSDVGVDVGWRPDQPIEARQRLDPKRAQFFVHRLVDLLFADDTSLLCRRKVLAEVEQLAQQVLLEWGEKVHPGKLERLVLGSRKRARRKRLRTKAPVQYATVVEDPK
eukprot:15441315-Alexandrium_andersonii.AAC.1